MSVRAGIATAFCWTGAAIGIGNAVTVRRPDPTATPSTRSVAVLIPMRDEAAQVAACLRSVRALRHAGQLRILVLDDESSDSTGELARAVAADDPRVQVIPGTPLPADWLGKPFACAQLADAVSAADAAETVGDADILVFLDADVRLHPSALAATAQLMDRLDWQFCSPYPRQLAGSWLEHLVQPLLQWSWLTSVPLRLAETGRFPSMGIANGQFLAVTMDAYRRAGGHGAVRGEVVEDVALARALLRTGSRGAVCSGRDIAQCRMYSTARELADGYAKSLARAWGSSPAALAVAGGALAVFLPRRGRIGVLGYLGAVTGRVVSARLAGDAPAAALTHPFSVVAFAVLTARSVLLHRRRQVTWKGRPVTVRAR